MSVRVPTRLPPAEKLEYCITHLYSFADRPGETLTQRMDRTTVEHARDILTLWINLLRNLLRVGGYQERIIDSFVRKFADAGRRSPPWQTGSEQEGKRLPQDGAEGNRRNRWLFDPDHKFYAPEDVASLCEARYFLQTLSMEGAPQVPDGRLETEFITILGHPLKPSMFLDPIQKIPIEFQKFAEDRRYVESGHLVPLGRGGRHTPDNATLMLKQSNRMQSDLTIHEMLKAMIGILGRHGYQVATSNE